jgi:hypothetical protein
VKSTLITLRNNWGLILGILYFGAWFTYNATNIPFLDANLDFIKGVSFHTGGIESLVTEFSSVHPLGKEIVLAFSFTLFGVSPSSYYLVALPFFLIGVFSIKGLTERIFNDTYTGNVAALLLATSPIFIAVGVQALTDFMIACLFLFILKNALESRFIPTLIGICLALSIKETALGILPVIILLFLIFPDTRLIKKVCQISLLTLIPISVLWGWKLLLESYGSGLWHVWVYGQSGDADAINTVLSNLLHFRILNKYFVENLKHLFILNFNWVYWIAWFVSIAKFGIKKHFPLLLASSSYLILVLSFPTYSIPRYILPVLVLVYVGSSQTFQLYRNKFLPIFLFVFLNIVSGFFSLDPISLRVWAAPNQYSRFWVFRQTLYNLDEKISGNDRITYNLQSLMISSERTTILKTMSGVTKIDSPDCLWLTRDPTHDLFTLRILGIYKTPTFPECNRKL